MLSNSRLVTFAFWVVVAVSLPILTIGGYMALDDLGVFKPHAREAVRRHDGPPFDSGNALIKLISSYRDLSGRYPRSLDSLVTDTATKLLLPEWGVNQWEYAVNDAQDTFVLSVRYEADDYSGHVFEKGKWYYNR